ncbi:MAG: recombination regulator RecX [Lachnospiraceae bacterium]|nr:recombination regulator RecX [Lachnospiraceae bacterium]
MKVTRLFFDGKYKVRIDIDGDYAFFLYKKELRKLKIKEGAELSAKAMNDIYELLLYPRCKNKALGLLQYRNRTCKELRDKLSQNGYPEIIVARVMQFLIDYGFLDDEAYTRSYIELKSGRKSRLQLQQELARKGISRELFQSIWEEQPEDFEEEGLRIAMEKRMRSKGPVTKENFQKHYGYFARKGYSSGRIINMLKEYQE